MTIKVYVWLSFLQLTAQAATDIETRKVVVDYMLQIEKMDIPFKEEFKDMIIPGMMIAYYTETQRFFDQTPDDQKVIVERLADFSGKSGSYFCLMKGCNMMTSHCVKFDLEIYLNSESAIKEAAYRITINQRQISHLLPTYYDEIKMHKIVQAVLAMSTNDVTMLLQDLSIPDSIQHILDVDGDDKLTEREKLIVYFTRYELVTEQVSRHIEVMFGVPKHDNLNEFLHNVASLSVGCKSLPISTVFDDIFFEKLDHLISHKHDIEEMIQKAAKLKAFNTYEYCQLNQAFRHENDDRLREYLEESKEFFCDQLSCQSSEECQYFDRIRLFNEEEHWNMLNDVTNPPVKLLMELDGSYDVKKMYFILRELLNNHDERPIKAVVAALDLNWGGFNKKDEEKLKEYLTKIMDFGFLDHTFKLIRNVVNDDEETTVYMLADENVYCVYNDIQDHHLYEKAKDSKLLLNAPTIIVNAIEISKSLTSQEAGNIPSVLKDISEYITSFENFLCDNFPCNIEGRCRMRDILSSLDKGERESMIKALQNPPREIMMLLPRITIREFTVTAQRLTDGYFGDFDTIFYADEFSVPDTLFAVLDGNFNNRLEDYEVLHWGYIRLVFGRIFISKSINILLNLMNAHWKSAIDETLASVTRCECMTGFSGRHCESCESQEFLDIINRPALIDDIL